jgi:hypothetical protein
MNPFINLLTSAISPVTIGLLKRKIRRLENENAALLNRIDAVADKLKRERTLHAVTHTRLDAARKEVRMLRLRLVQRRTKPIAENPYG